MEVKQSAGMSLVTIIMLVTVFSALGLIALAVGVRNFREAQAAVGAEESHLEAESTLSVETLLIQNTIFSEIDEEAFKSFITSVALGALSKAAVDGATVADAESIGIALGNDEDDNFFSLLSISDVGDLRDIFRGSSDMLFSGRDYWNTWEDHFEELQEFYNNLAALQENHRVEMGHFDESRRNFDTWLNNINTADWVNNHGDDFDGWFDAVFSSGWYNDLLGDIRQSDRQRWIIWASLEFLNAVNQDDCPGGASCACVALPPGLDGAYNEGQHLPPPLPERPITPEPPDRGMIGLNYFRAGTSVLGTDTRTRLVLANGEHLTPDEFVNEISFQPTIVERGYLDDQNDFQPCDDEDSGNPVAFRITVIPYVAVSVEAEGVHFTRSVDIEMPMSFVLTFQRGGISNSASFSHVDGNHHNSVVEILRHPPFYVPQADRPPGATCERSAAYILLRQGIAEIINAGPPSPIPGEGNLFPTASVSPPGGNYAYNGTEWVSLGNIYNMDTLRTHLQNTQFVYAQITDNFIFNTGLTGNIDVHHLHSINFAGNTRFQPGLTFSGNNTIVRVGGDLEINFDAANLTTTLNGLQLHAVGNIRINQSGTVANANLLGNSVYVGHANQVIAYGDNFTMGSLTAAPQIIGQRHIAFRGINSKFYGILTSSVETQFDLANIHGLTVTGIVVANLFTSNAGVYEVNQPPSDINDRIMPSTNLDAEGNVIVLDASALNLNTPIMQTILPFLDGDTSNTLGGLVVDSNAPELLLFGPGRWNN
ncbi:MAG: hypothetical protein FWF79_05225 [Defluviitaleaceae bacterium]|nr:hypothetical protein [Defluviitaleaceae bacterium]